MNYSGGNLVLAAAMLVSSMVLLLSLSRKRVPPPPAHDISQHRQVKAPRSCLLPSGSCSRSYSLSGKKKEFFCVDPFYDVKRVHDSEEFLLEGTESGLQFHMLTRVSLCADGRKGERKKKRVKFADDVKEDCSVRSSTEESKKLQRSCKIEEQGMVGMQSNGVVPVLIHHHL